MRRFGFGTWRRCDTWRLESARCKVSILRREFSSWDGLCALGFEHAWPTQYLTPDMAAHLVHLLKDMTLHQFSESLDYSVLERCSIPIYFGMNLSSESATTRLTNK